MLLTTKFLRPTPDPRSVRRHRLDDLLEPDQGKSPDKSSGEIWMIRLRPFCAYY